MVGVAFLVVLAAQYGYFGPEIRTLGAAVLGAALISGGVFVRQRDRKNFGAPALVVTGIAAIFLSIYSASALYGWLPPLAGTLLCAGVGVAGLALALTWDDEVIGAISMAGAALMCIWIGTPQPLATLAVLSCFTGITLFLRRPPRWAWLPYLALVPTATGFWVYAMDVIPGMADQLVLLALLSVVVAALSVVFVWVTPSRTPWQAPVLVIAGAIPAAVSWSQLADQALAIIALVVLAIAYTVVALVPGTPRWLESGALPAGAILAVVAAGLAVQDNPHPLPFLLVALAYLALAAARGSRLTLAASAVPGAMGFATWLPATDVLSTPLVEVPAESLLSSAMIVALGAGVGFGARRMSVRQDVATYIGVALTVLGGAVLLPQVGIALTQTSGSLEGVYQACQAAVTVATFAWGLSFLRRALQTGPGASVYLRVGFALVIVAVLKLMVVDTRLFNSLTRVAILIAVGLTLLIMGTRFARSWGSAHRTTQQSPTGTMGPGQQPQWPAPPAWSAAGFPPPNSPAANQQSPGQFMPGQLPHPAPSDPQYPPPS